MNIVYVLFDEMENQVFGIAKNLSAALIAIWDELEEELNSEEWEKLLLDYGYDSKEELQQDFFNGGFEDSRLNAYTYYPVPLYE